MVPRRARRGGLPGPAERPAAVGGKAPVPAASGSQPAAPGARPAAPTGPQLGVAGATGENRPFDLTAKKVEVWIARSPLKSQVEKLECLGTVSVTQRKSPGQPRSTEVKGDSLKMTSQQEGLYHLVVTGDLGELQTESIYIAGPEVHIDQLANEAWVVGDGVMTMESKSNWQGEELAKSVPLTVHWSKSMLFNGRSAEFHGNIQAEQDRGRLGCQVLEVTFDRPIVVAPAEPGKAKQPAVRVSNMVCDRDVRVEERSTSAPGWCATPPAPGGHRREHGGAGGRRARREGKGRQQARRLRPGEHSRLGGSRRRAVDDRRGGAAAKPASKAAGQPLVKPAAKSGPSRKVTLVNFGRQMVGNSQSGKATFYDGVRVLNMPCEKHDAKLDMDVVLETDLPEGALYIKCDKLEVLDRKVDGQPSKEMKSTGKVLVLGKEFWRGPRRRTTTRPSSRWSSTARTAWRR